MVLTILYVPMWFQKFRRVHVLDFTFIFSNELKNFFIWLRYCLKILQKCLYLFFNSHSTGVHSSPSILARVVQYVPLALRFRLGVLVTPQYTPNATIFGNQAVTINKHANLSLSVSASLISASVVISPTRRYKKIKSMIK